MHVKSGFSSFDISDCYRTTFTCTLQRSLTWYENDENWFVEFGLLNSSWNVSLKPLHSWKYSIWADTNIYLLKQFASAYDATHLVSLDLLVASKVYWYLQSSCLCFVSVKQITLILKFPSKSLLLQYKVTAMVLNLLVTAFATKYADKNLEFFLNLVFRILRTLCKNVKKKSTIYGNYKVQRSIKYNLFIKCWIWRNKPFFFFCLFIPQ